MSNIVCQVESQPDRIAFTWSQGKDAFAPYHLCGDIARNFAELARELRITLADVVTSYLEVARTPEQNEVVQEHRRACLTLAQAGYKLYKRIFNPGKADKSEGITAGEVSKWLKKLQQLNDLTRLEIVHKGTQPLTVPWNLVYDTMPDEQAFLSARESPAHWRPFWGIRYDLSGGKQVDPLRRMPWWNKKPRVWMVVDHETVHGLPEDQRHALNEFRQRHGPVWIESAGELKKQLASGRPDLMYWLCHADPNALYLDGEPIRPRQLLELLENDDAEESDERTGGLVFLNACQTAESGEAGSFAETFHSLGMCGLIATEHQTIDTFASPFGLDFLDAFLTRGEAIGPVLQRLRGRVPLGLLYAAYCPPDIRVLPPEDGAGESIDVRVDAPRTGGTLGPGPAIAPSLPPLPEKPYCSLQFYDRADRALFVGRDDDVLRFARLLDDPATRLLVLHGESGVGKSSFLRAGLLPYLEEECVGYHFLRDRSKDEVLFVRATNDLTGQLADAMHRFCAKPFSARTPKGKNATIDLPGLLRRVVGKETDAFGLRTALCDDPSLLSRLLAALSEALPFTILLVIDQGEEVFTLARNESDAANRRVALQILREAVASSGDFKLIVALRTEYYGRFVDRMRRGAKESKGVREYLLTDFDEATLAEAVRRPTSKTPIPHAKEVPFEKYNFFYAERVPEALAKEVITYTTNRQDSALPLLQVICTQLYERAVQSPDHVIRLEDLQALGGLKGGMRRHVYSLVARLFPFRKDREAFRRLLTGLYLSQPDGALTTALMPADELARQWRGRIPFGEMLQTGASGEWRLLRVTSLRLGGDEERRYVSLGHDALAQVAEEWDYDFKRGARLRRLVAAVVGTAVIAVVMTGLAVWALAEQSEVSRQAKAARIAEKEAKKQADDAEAARRDTQRNLYFAEMNLAGQAAQTNGRGASFLDELLSHWRPTRGEPDQRGWEWYYLRSLFPRPQLTLHRHHGEITAVCWSPDGRRLASASDDQTVMLWDAQTGQHLKTLRGHTKGVRALAWCSDGQILASGDAAGVVRLWDVKTGQALRDFRHEAGVYGVSFSPDGTQLASGGQDRKVTVWDTQDGELKFSLQGTTWVKCISFSRDGTQLAGGCDDGRLHVWNLATRKRVTLLRHRYAWLDSLSWAPDGHRLACVQLDEPPNPRIRIWDTDSGQLIRALTGEAGGSRSVDWSPDGRYLATGDQEQTVRIWDPETGRMLAVVQIQGKKAGVRSVKWSPDGTRLAAAGQDQTLKVWDAAELLSTASALEALPDINAVRWSPDSQILALGGRDGVVRLWDATRRQTATLDRQPGSVMNLAWHPDGRRLAVSSDRPEIIIWDVQVKQVIVSLKGHKSSVSSVAWSHDGHRLASASNDGTVRVWDADRQTELHKFEGHRRGIHAVCWSPHDHQLASCTANVDDGTVRIWDVDARRERYRMNGWYYAMSWSPKDGRLALPTRLWDTQTRRETVSLRGHTSDVSALGWSPDGQRLASGAGDQTVRIWDPDTGRQIVMLPTQNQAKGALDWSPDGRWLTSVGQDGKVRLWDALTGYLAEGSPLALPELDRKLRVNPHSASDLLLRAELYARAGKWQEAAADWNEAQLVQRSNSSWFIAGWWVAGPFPATFEAAEEAATEIDPVRRPAEVPGEGESSALRWRLADASSDGCLDLSALPRHYKEKECACVLVRLYSPREEFVTARLDSTGDMRLRVNGAVVKEMKAVQPDQAKDEAAAVALREGWNTLVFRIGLGDQLDQLRMWLTRR